MHVIHHFQFKLQSNKDRRELRQEGRGGSWEGLINCHIIIIEERPIEKLSLVFINEEAGRAMFP